MKCLNCHQIETRVIDSRMNQSCDVTRRRRECPNCNFRFTTYERIEELLPDVLKKDGRREIFDREKIISGLRKACQKTKITAEQLHETVLQIEKKIQQLSVREIPTEKVGEYAMEALKDLDKVAYIRFASVYREFTDVQEFYSKIKDLMDHQEKK